LYKLRGPEAREENLPDRETSKASRSDSYWIGVSPFAVAKGEFGAAAVLFCQIVLPAFTANERVPVVPNVWGMPDAYQAVMVGVVLQSAGLRVLVGLEVEVVPALLRRLVVRIAEVLRNERLGRVWRRRTKHAVARRVTALSARRGIGDLRRRRDLQRRNGRRLVTRHTGTQKPRHRDRRDDADDRHDDQQLDKRKPLLSFASHNQLFSSK
jgi:hypothetical protein